MAQNGASLLLREGYKPKRPSLFHALGELRLPLEATVLWLNALSHPWPHAAPGQEKVVLFLPGFMAGDVTLAPMAAFCRWLGHHTAHAGIWVNSNCPRDTLQHVSARLLQIHRIRPNAPIVVVGHSLGGLYARGLSYLHPEIIERVITLGSPIKRPRRAANFAVEAVARSMAALRGKNNGCMSESCVCGLRIPDRAPEVPTTVVYSRTDGVVHWESCIDPTNSQMIEHVEVMGSHVGMAVNPDVYRIVADRLAFKPIRATVQSHAESAISA
jgi:alpha/beta hydrolase family protein